MKIQSLGHSSFVVEIAGDRPEPVRILADPWVADHVIGDLCGRLPRVRIDWRALGPIDAVYLSHSHTDHLDPYSLLQLAQELPEPPLLLLPESLTYLQPLLAEELPAWPCAILAEGVPLDLHGVEVSALFNLETRGTNEDDVMVLVVRNEREILISEADACLPFHDDEACAAIEELLVGVGDEDEPPVRVFLTTKNELGGTMASLRADGPEARREAKREAWERTAEDAESILRPEGPWQLPGGVVRLLIGQGIAAPMDLLPEWNRVLFPVTLEERASIEREIAAANGLDLSIAALAGGHELTVESGAVGEPGPIPGVEVLDDEQVRSFDPEVPCWESSFPVAPLIDTPRDIGAQQRRFRALLNERFLPWWIGARNPPVEHLLAHHGGEYRIRIRYGSAEEFTVEDFVASFARLRFTPTTPAEDPSEVQEEYWGNDLEDYLDGRADDFSTFCRRPPGGSASTLWDCLGFPYLNDDLVERKLRFHFERARAGHTGGDWVLPIWRGELPPGL
ncbi:MAG: MBL fold metallo-hydrolase [Planctomycetota bacterium]